MARQTQIIATLGPACEDPKILREMINAGVDLVRLNSSHGSHDQYLKFKEELEQIEAETGKKTPLLFDLQGPKIRIGRIETELNVKAGDELTLVPETSSQTKTEIPVQHFEYLAMLAKEGAELSIEDGLIRTKILLKQLNPDTQEVVAVKVRCENEGRIKAHKGINLPGTKLPEGSIPTEKDRADLNFALNELKPDYIAVSFVESAEDIIAIRELILEENQEHIKLIAKIEREVALENLQEIAEAADYLMIARGDLGVEMELENLPVIQQKILKTGDANGKPVIVATQLLSSMVSSPTPTRAEVSDIANAIFDGAEMLMVSNETSVGQHPVQVIQTLSEIIETSEKAVLKHQVN